VRETYFAIGRDLMEARERFPSNQEFGAWVDQQGFPFARTWGYTLRLAAENEPEVRLALASQLANGKSENFQKAVKIACPPTPREISRGRPVGQRRRKRRLPEPSVSVPA
jgi:hypothetical protein